MDNLTAGNPRAHRVRVFFDETSTLIYEGMPVCYDWDTTENWFGGSVNDAGVITESTTTAEGSQNEGKYIRVVTPLVTNFHAFAGVVAKGGWCGKTTSASKGILLDIYVPNGAIVPVRVGVNTLVGRTIVGLQTGLTYLVAPIAVEDFRPLGVACETDATLAAAPGITLTKLEPNMFLSQNFSTDLYVGAGVGAASWLQGLNHLAIETAHTSGGWDTLRVATNHSGVMAATGGACSINSYLKVTVASDALGATDVFYRATLSLTHLVGSVITNANCQVTGLHSQVGGSDDATVSHANALWADYGLTGTITGRTEVIYVTNNSSGGAVALDNMMYFYAPYCNSFIEIEAAGEGATHFIDDCAGTMTVSADDKAIKIRIDGDTYWLIAVDSIPAG